MYNTFNGYMQGAQPYGNPYATTARISTGGGGSSCSR